MNPYDNLAEEIKESIIEEYLRKNPDISRSEIVSQIQNGRVVVGTISELMQKISNRTSIQKSLSGPNESLLKKLAERWRYPLRQFAQIRGYFQNVYTVAFRDTVFQDLPIKNNPKI